MLLVKIKDYTALIDNKPFFDQSVKKNKKCMKNLYEVYEMSKKDDYRKIY